MRKEGLLILTFIIYNEDKKGGGKQQETQLISLCKQLAEEDTEKANIAKSYKRKEVEENHERLCPER